ncbi:MAG: dehydrogenase subunit [Rhodocyclaceae bacterium]|nr:dehydrogenase subunit [Rhodocyclaceae bacterium]
MLNADDLLALGPLLALLAATVLTLLLVAVRRSHGLAAGTAAVGLLACLALLPGAARLAPRDVDGLLLLDPAGLFYLGLISLAALATCLMAYAYLERFDGRREEFYVLLLAATLGAGSVVLSDHFAAFFLGLELMSVSLFALIAYPAARQRPLEAGIKYLILAGLSSALLAFGIALIYYDSGSLQFSGFGACFGARPMGATGQAWLLLAGNALLLAGLGFKLSLVPFHLWAPDVYEGAPAPAAGFLATVSKGAIAAMLVRYAGETQLHDQPAMIVLLELAAILSIAAGNLLALLQDNLKRLLAYSSIAHLGYLLVAVIAGGTLGAEAVAYYLLAYFAMNLGAFGVIAALSSGRRDGEGEADRLEDYRGLFWHKPLLAGILTVNLLSLAGIPLTIGFIGKFYLFASGVGAARWLLVAALVAGSIVGLFYYLRVVIVLFARQPAAPAPGIAGNGAAWASALTLSFLALTLVWLGLYPEPAMELIRSVHAPFYRTEVSRLRLRPPPLRPSLRM